MKTKTVRYVTLALLLLWMCVIFCFSAQTAEASTKTSSKVIEKVVAVVYPDYDTLDEPEKQEVVKNFTIPIRKAAHFFEFAVLGALFFTFYLTFGKLKKYRYALALVSGGLYAVSDELHQTFISGRACRAFDIIIDICGVLFALLIYFALSFMRRRKKVEKR